MQDSGASYREPLRGASTVPAADLHALYLTDAQGVPQTLPGARRLPKACEVGRSGRSGGARQDTDVELLQ
jgi:hypothetical protein